MLIQIAIGAKLIIGSTPLVSVSVWAAEVSVVRFLQCDAFKGR